MKKHIIPIMTVATIAPITSLLSCNSSNSDVITLQFREKLDEYSYAYGFIYQNLSLQINKLYEFIIKFSLMPESIFVDCKDKSFGFWADKEGRVLEPNKNSVVVKLNGNTLTEGVEWQFIEGDRIETRIASGWNETDILSIQVSWPEQLDEADDYKYNILCISPD